MPEVYRSLAGRSVVSLTRPLQGRVVSALRASEFVARLSAAGALVAGGADSLHGGLWARCKSLVFAAGGLSPNLHRVAIRCNALHSGRIRCKGGVPATNATKG